MAGVSLLHGGPADDYRISARTALIVASNDEEAQMATLAAEAAGCVARAPIRFEDVAHDLSEYAGLDLILIEAASASEALLELVLARADTLSRERALAVIATVTLDQLDIAAAQLLGPRVQLLCAPDSIDRVAAILRAEWRPHGVAEDVNREAETMRFRRLNEEVARIADTLVRLTRGEDAASRGSASVRAPDMGFRGAEDEDEPVKASEVRAVIRSRRLRSQYFDTELFADPAWDMLLDLYAAGLERRRVSVSSLCIAAAVPPTTALRWIGTLHDAGLFERQADPSDRRRAYIALSAKGIEGMRNYAGAVKRAGLSLV